MYKYPLFLFIFALILATLNLGFAAQPKTSIKKKHLKIHGVQKTKCTSCDDNSVSKPLIVLDAGHGGNDEGAKVHGLVEKKITLRTTLLIKKALETHGYKVHLTRSKDSFVSLQKRVNIANQIDAILFLSIHYNSSKNNTAKGIEIFYNDSSELWRNKASRRLASCVLNQMVQETGASSRGVKKGNFFVIRETQMPSVLIEVGFMTCPEERAVIKKKEYQEKIAQGIAKGVDRYLKA